MKSSYTTWKFVATHRPRIVVATNPSYVLGLVLLVLRLFYRFRVVSDAHLAGVDSIPGMAIPQWALDLQNRWVDGVIVTNPDHADKIHKLGTRAWVCPDPLPELPTSADSRVSPGERSVFFICSFDRDEPYLEVFEAFRELERDGFQLFVSGNPSKAGLHTEDFPWINFLGFVPEDEYFAYLRQAEIVMDLTTMENCLVCGAYEALAAHQPLILSDTRATKSYFGSAVVLTQNTAHSVAESVRRAHRDVEQLRRRATEWVTANEQFMNDRIRELARALSELACSDATPRT